MANENVIPVVLNDAIKHSNFMKNKEFIDDIKAMSANLLHTKTYLNF